MLDIGQGDSIFIQSPTGVQVLIDAGPPKNIIGKLSKVMPLLDRSIDSVIMTHPDQDHIGGFADVLKLYKVSSVFEPGVYGDSKTYQNLEKEIQNKKIPHFLARKGTRLDLGGGVYLYFIFPDRDVYDWETNDASVVAKLVYGENTFIFTGDATTQTEKLILENNKDEFLDVDFLKVGHHGSRTSTSYDFVKTLSPEYALISDGKNNKYGHPHQEVLDLLSEFGVKVLRTDELGTVVIKCDTIAPCKINK